MKETAQVILTADIAVFRLPPSGDTLQILLIQRLHQPYRGAWALPGGKMNKGETIEQCAYRELREETLISGIKLLQGPVFSDPLRDPRGLFVSVSYFGLALGNEADNARAGDDAGKLAWFDVDKLPLLAFDHFDILSAILDGVKYPKNLIGYAKEGE